MEGSIIIDVEELIDTGITMEQYFILCTLSLNRVDLIVKYVHKYGEFKISDLESLKNKELINYNEFTNDITTIKLTDKGNSFIHIMKVENQIEKIQSNSMQFDELLELYPKKTPKGRALQAGYRLNREKWSKMYFANLKKSGFTHEQVIDAIKNEIKSRTINNTLEYLSMLPTYINQGKWDSYISTVVNPVQYGDDFK